MEPRSSIRVRRPAGRMPRDIQRDLHFYRTVVAFRNAIERMQIVHGTVDDPDEVHWWWGFGYLGWPRTGLGGDEGHDWDDPDDLTGSRVPRRPFGGAGAACAEATPLADDEGDLIALRRVSA